MSWGISRNSCDSLGKWLSEMRGRGGQGKPRGRVRAFLKERALLRGRGRGGARGAGAVRRTEAEGAESGGEGREQSVNLRLDPLPTWSNNLPKRPPSPLHHWHLRQEQSRGLDQEEGGRSRGQEGKQGRSRDRQVLPMREGCSPRAARRSSRSPDIRQWGGRSRGSRDRSPHRFSPKRLLSRCRSPLVALGSPQRLCSPRGHSPLPRRLASPPPRGFFPVRKGGPHLSEQNYLTRAEDKSIAECKYHIKGYCKFQEGCYFFHSKPIFTISQFRDKSCKQRHPKQCRYNDQCRRRTTCRFSHKPPPANDLSLLGCFSPRLGPPHGHLDPEGRHSPPHSSLLTGAPLPQTRLPTTSIPFHTSL